MSGQERATSDRKETINSNQWDTVSDRKSLLIYDQRGTVSCWTRVRDSGHNGTIPQ